MTEFSITIKVCSENLDIQVAALRQFSAGLRHVGMTWMADQLAMVSDNIQSAVHGIEVAVREEEYARARYVDDSEGNEWRDARVLLSPDGRVLFTNY